MTRKEFIKVLDEKGYSYEMEGDKIVVTPMVSINLSSLMKLPSRVEFRNGGYVNLDSLTSLQPGIQFKNERDVLLRSLTGKWFDYWSGNIEGIKSQRLLNKMIELGLFNKDGKRRI